MRSINTHFEYILVKNKFMNYSIPNYGKHLIPLSLAKEMILRYSELKKSILAEEYKDSDLLANSETFNADDIRLLLLQPNCHGFRIYYGMDDTKKIHAILTGVDMNGNDITINNPNLKQKENGEFVLEEGARCPPMCPPNNSINK